MVEKKKITCKAGQCWHAQCLHFAREGRTACRELSDSFPAPGIRGQTRKLGAQSGLIHRDCPGQGWGSRRRDGEEGSSAPSVSASPGLPVHLWAPGAGPTRGERKRLQREWDVALFACQNDVSNHHPVSAAAWGIAFRESAPPPLQLPPAKHKQNPHQTPNVFT